MLARVPALGRVVGAGVSEALVGVGDGIGL